MKSTSPDPESLAGTSSQLSNGLPGSGTPTATVSSQQGYLADPQNTGTQLVVDKIDRSTQTNIRCFSPQLCIDLVDKLSDAQMSCELERIYDKSYAEIRNTPRKKNFSLKQHFTSVLMTDGDTLTHRLNDLTAHFSRHVSEANSQLEELRRNIDSAQTLVADIQTPATSRRALPVVPEIADISFSPSPAPVPSDVPVSQQSPGNLDPFKLYDGNPFAEFEAGLLDSATEYDRDFGSRKTAYYGSLPYKYGGSHHKARDIDSNPYLKSIIDKLVSLSPDVPESSNSFLVTKYDSHTAHIPPHSDNEPSIDPNSSILTITLGTARPVVFRRKLPGKYERFSITPEHGSLYLMTRSSQNLFDHSVPRVKQEQCTGTRISITCRTLISPSSRTKQSPATRPSTTTSQPGPKRVLVLSDSKNASFDCSELQEPVVAFRNDLFLLRDLDQHDASIRQADVVLISAGINDLRKNGANPLTLHNHVKHFIAKYRHLNVQFIFDSISPLSMNADRFNKMNQAIDQTNELLLQLSLRSSNFKLFDNVLFGLPHLARDGIHFNKQGKTVLTRCWIHCILLTLGLRKGPLPLRVRYVNIVDRFSLPS